MLKYVLKRLLQSVLTVLIIVSVVFLLMRLMPTDYFFTEDELMKLKESEKQDRLEASGLLDPAFVQLGRFYKNMFTLDYTYDVQRKANLAASLTSGVSSSVHSSIEGAIAQHYTDAAAAAKETDKLNNKVMTDSVIQKIIDAALLVDNGGENSVTIDYLASSLYDKAGATLNKDAKKALGEENATVLMQSFKEQLGAQLAGSLGSLDLSTEESGWKSFWHHLNPLNYKLTFFLGNSYRIQHGISALKVIGDKLPYSITIGLCSLAISLVLGVVLGILQARYKDSLLDHVGAGYTIFVNAVPHLVSYTLIMYLCARLFNLPMTYRSNTPVASSIPPILCLAMASTASYMLWMRRYMVDELNKDYIRLAQLKGLTRTQVMFRHVMKNAFLPLAQYLPYNVLLTVGGSLLAESFFSVPGMGPLLTLAISRYDTVLVQAIVMLYATMGVFGVFIGDLLMGILDPRIRLTKSGGTR